MTTAAPETTAFAPLQEPEDLSGGFWVFGYGSLMWNPGFRHQDRRLAELTGYARRFCLWSIHYRGTPEAPGLVLGLDGGRGAGGGASTRGVAFQVGAEDAVEALAYLRARELVSDAYREEWRHIELLCQPENPVRTARAVTYVVDPAHDQYAGGVSLEAQAEVIAARAGPSGLNSEYLFNTMAHLRELGVRDDELERLEAMVRGRLAASAQV